MANAQKWLEEHFPKNITKIGATPGKEKEGELKIENYLELKSIVVDEAKLLSKLLVINCPKVEHIIVSGSKLSQIDINGCSKLTMLYCNKNNLKKIDISGNPQLKWLNCADNPLEKIVGLEVNKLTNLSYLRLPDNFNIMSSLSNNKVTGAEGKLGKSLDEIISNTAGILGDKNLNDLPSGKNLADLLSEIVLLKKEVANLKATQETLKSEYDKEKEKWSKKEKMLNTSQGMSEGMKNFLKVETDKAKNLELEELIEQVPQTPNS